LEHLQFADKDSLLVCGADKIHNTAAYINDYRKDGPDIWNRFNASPQKKIAFYSNIAEILKTHLDNDMGDRLEEELETLMALLPVEAEAKVL